MLLAPQIGRRRYAAHEQTQKCASPTRALSGKSIEGEANKHERRRPQRGRSLTERPPTCRCRPLMLPRRRGGQRPVEAARQSCSRCQGGASTPSGRRGVPAPGPPCNGRLQALHEGRHVTRRAEHGVSTPRREETGGRRRRRRCRSARIPAQRAPKRTNLDHTHGHMHDPNRDLCIWGFCSPGGARCVLRAASGSRGFHRRSGPGRHACAVFRGGHGCIVR